MIAMLTYTSREKEIPVIRDLTKNLAAHLSTDKWELFYFSSLQEVQDFFEKQPVVHMACYDVTSEGGLTCLGKIRKRYKDMFLMLIADKSLSPMEYVRPDILASNLIIRPFTKEVMKDKLKDMFMEYFAETKDEGEEAFVISGKEGKTWIPYNQIYYMEARNKKIYIRLKDKELAFYDTIEELEKKLPNAFMRCHRSFLVNRTYIEKILLAQGEIVLAHGITIPLSRSYKPRFKELR